MEKRTKTSKDIAISGSNITNSLILFFYGKKSNYKMELKITYHSKYKKLKCDYNKSKLEKSLRFAMGFGFPSEKVRENIEKESANDELEFKKKLLLLKDEYKVININLSYHEYNTDDGWRLIGTTEDGMEVDISFLDDENLTENIESQGENLLKKEKVFFLKYVVKEKECVTF